MCSAKNCIATESGRQLSLCLRMLNIISWQISTMCHSGNPLTFKGVGFLIMLFVTWNAIPHKTILFLMVGLPDQYTKPIFVYHVLEDGFPCTLNNPLLHNFKGRKYIFSDCRLSVPVSREGLPETAKAEGRCVCPTIASDKISCLGHTLFSKLWIREHRTPVRDDHTMSHFNLFILCYWNYTPGDHWPRHAYTIHENGCSAELSRSPRQSSGFTLPQFQVSPNSTAGTFSLPWRPVLAQVHDWPRLKTPWLALCETHHIPEMQRPRSKGQSKTKRQYYLKTIAAGFYHFVDMKFVHEAFLTHRPLEWFNFAVYVVSSS